MRIGYRQFNTSTPPHLKDNHRLIIVVRANETGPLILFCLSLLYLLCLHPFLFFPSFFVIVVVCFFKRKRVEWPMMLRSSSFVFIQSGNRQGSRHDRKRPAAVVAATVAAAGAAAGAAAVVAGHAASIDPVGKRKTNGRFTSTTGHFFSFSLSLSLFLFSGDGEKEKEREREREREREENGSELMTVLSFSLSFSFSPDGGSHRR